MLSLPVFLLEVGAQRPTRETDAFNGAPIGAPLKGFQRGACGAPSEALRAISTGRLRRRFRGEAPIEGSRVLSSALGYETFGRPERPGYETFDAPERPAALG